MTDPTEALLEGFQGHPRLGELRCALEAARAAGEVLLAKHEQLDPTRIGSKSAARDLVTEADLESERVIVQALRSAFPAHAIEAEESTPDEHGDGARWFVDPLDGTTNFVHGLHAYAVSMGLWDGGRPEVAVVHAPRLAETFVAIRGAGGFLSGPGFTRRLGVRPTESIGEAVLATGFPYRRGELANPNLGNFCEVFPEVRGLRRIGSAALDLAWVASGRLDGYWELHLSPHDVAAGGLLVQEAGGYVTDGHGGQGWLRGGSIVAAGPALHAALLPRLEI